MTELTLRREAALWEAAASALARLVRGEYPAVSLTEIADTWGRASDEEVAALEWYERRAGVPDPPTRDVGFGE